jgi:hypothetical protein
MTNKARFTMRICGAVMASIVSFSFTTFSQTEVTLLPPGVEALLSVHHNWYGPDGEDDSDEVDYSETIDLHQYKISGENI